MSSGGQNGIDLSGITGLRIQNASDVTRRRHFQMSFQDVIQIGGNTPSNHYLHNSYGYLRDALNGVKEDCADCSGLPYALVGSSSGSACATDSNWLFNVSGGTYLDSSSSFTVRSSTNSNGLAYAFRRYETLISNTIAYTFTGNESTNWAFSFPTNQDPATNINFIFSNATTLSNLGKDSNVTDGSAVISTIEPCNWFVFGVYTSDDTPPQAQLTVNF